MKNIQLTNEEILHICIALVSRRDNVNVYSNYPKDKILKEEKLADDILNKLYGQLRF